MGISVCIATYNGEKYLEEQLDSILSQLGDDDEVIISDDGSNDNTLQIIDGYNDPRILFFKNKSKKGVNHNFENALKNARGSIIFLADQDDIWLPNKVQVCVNELLESDIVVSNCIVVDVAGLVIHPSYFEAANSGKGFLKNIYKSSYLGCCLAFRRDVLIKVLPIPTNLMLFHDWWFGFIAECCFKVKFIDTPCMYYRRHGETNSNTLSKSKFSLGSKISFRLQLLYLGLKRIIKIRY
ncbi:MAG TPA: glycosyltransferase family 2 protein [Flavobacterium sp.]